MNTKLNRFDSDGSVLLKQTGKHDKVVYLIYSYHKHPVQHLYYIFDTILSSRNAETIVVRFK